MGVFDKVKSSISGSNSDKKGGDFDGNKYDDSFQGGSQNPPPSSQGQNPGQNMNQGPGNSGGSDDLSDIGIERDPAPSPNDSQGGSQNMDAQGRQPDQGPQAGPNMNQGPQTNPPGQSSMDAGGAPGSDNSGSDPSDLKPSYGDENPSGTRNDSPNPQTGRPREGSTEPQVSQETEEKMEQAGFEMNSGDRGRGGRDRKKPVSDRRDDLEEIKSQNEQIIELLKRINSTLTGSGRSRHGGRR